MAIKALQKPVKKDSKDSESKVNEFISKGGSLAIIDEQEGDHRLTLRIPKWLMAKVDNKRKKRVGNISRNLWILEIIDQATKD
jgi:hypothetical protein